MTWGKPGTLPASAGLVRGNHSYWTWLTLYAKAGRRIICNKILEYLHSELSEDGTTKCVAKNFYRRGGMGKRKKIHNKNGQFRVQEILACWCVCWDPTQTPGKGWQPFCCPWDEKTRKHLQRGCIRKRKCALTSVQSSSFLGVVGSINSLCSEENYAFLYYLGAGQHHFPCKSPPAWWVVSSV